MTSPHLTDVPMDLNGSEFTGAWVVLDAAAVAAFEQGTFVQDNDVAMDDDRYPEGLVEGFHQIGLLDDLTQDVDLLPGWNSHLTGVLKVRFTSAMSAGDRFRLRGQVTDVTSAPHEVRIVVDGSLEVEGRDKPGSVLRWEQAFRPGTATPVTVPISAAARSGPDVDESVLEASAPFVQVPGLAGRSFSGSWLTLDPDRYRTFLDSVTLRGQVQDTDRVVRDTYLLGLLDHLLNPVVHVSGDPFFGWNYGLDGTVFGEPARLGDRVRGTGTVASVEPRGEGHLVCLDVAIEVAGRTEPAVTTSWRTLWLPEP